MRHAARVTLILMPSISVLRGVFAVAVFLAAASAFAWNPSAGDLSKSDAKHIRLMAYNTQGSFISDPAADASYQRILQAVQPDIIAFEEISDTLTAAQLRTRLDALMPLGAGRNWTVFLGLSDGTNRNVLASRWTQTLQITDTTPASEVRGVVGALVDLPDANYSKDFYAMGVHLKAFAGGTNTTRRQRACDALAKWFGDIRTAGGAITLPSGTPALVMGDFNFVDPEPQQPEVTLRTGNIIDNATFGSDIKGDWDATDLRDLQPADPYTADKDTWSTADPSPTSRLDRFYWTDNAVAAVRGFVLNTKTMNAAQLAAAGLQSGDSANASDHYPVVADFAVPLAPVALSGFTVE
jgi:endonuclease/exonuclease/phosphatase family metal-dependent hydrolase